MVVCAHFVETFCQLKNIISYIIYNISNTESQLVGVYPPKLCLSCEMNAVFFDTKQATMPKSSILYSYCGIGL